MVPQGDGRPGISYNPAMNYAAHYDKLIDRARNRVLDGYVERHHVLPKCMGGGNEPGNIVRLTGREHWFAHKLLIFIYPNNRRLVHAAVWMAKRAANGRVYEWLRHRNAIAVGDAHRGKKLSAEHIAKLSEFHRGNQYKKGRIVSAETREKLSIAGNGRKQTIEDRAKKSASRTGKKHSAETLLKLRKPKSQEHCAKLSAAAKLRGPVSAETKAKLSLARKGKRPNFGKKHTDETKARMSAAHAKRRAAQSGVSL